jgi:hypothetical protein
MFIRFLKVLGDLAPNHRGLGGFKRNKRYNQEK